MDLLLDFISLFRGIIGSQVANMVMPFLARGNLLKELNQSLIGLIPKGNQQETFKDFKPINLCNVSYKFITKILVNRLQGVLEKIISPFQNAFIKGR